MATSSKLRIDVWSDYVCPFCFLQLPELHRLEQEFGSAVEIVWRAFELRPEPRHTLDPAGDYLRTTWERSVYPMALERGLMLQLPPVQPHSRKAMEVAAFARAHHMFDAMHVALFRAFFQQGCDIGETEVLVELGLQLGLDPNELRQALFQQRYTQEVVEDEQLAMQLGINGVPTAILRLDPSGWLEAEPLQGAVPYETLRAAVERRLGKI